MQLAETSKIFFSETSTKTQLGTLFEGLASQTCGLDTVLNKRKSKESLPFWAQLHEMHSICPLRISSNIQDQVVIFQAKVL